MTGRGVPADWLHHFRFGVFVIALPSPLREQVEALRRQFDPVSDRVAPPHITVTQPLAEEPNDIARADLGATLAEFAPFDVQIGPATVFPDTAVVYLEIQPAAPILSMRAAAHATGLFRVDLPFTEGFVPHVTIREWMTDGDEDEATVSQAADAVARNSFSCGVLELWRPRADGRFGPVDRVHLIGR